MRLHREEFQYEDDSSDSEGNEEVEKLLLIDFAMMERFVDEDEEEDFPAQTYSLNDWKTNERTLKKINQKSTSIYQAYLGLGLKII